jgi:hypothetical protein
MTRRAKFLVAFVVSMLVVGTGTAYAFWTASNTGNAVASAGTLAAPANFTATATGTTTANLSWTAPANVTSYTLSQSPGSIAGCSATPTSATTACTATGLSPGTSYTWTLTAVFHNWTSASVQAGDTTDAADVTAPVFTITTSGSNPYYSGSGNTVYFRNSGSGSFTVTASDPESGISSSTFPNAPSGWSRTTGTNSATYTHGSGNSTVNLTGFSATNGASLTANFTVALTVDSNGPTGGALSVNGTNANSGGTTSSTTSTAFTIGTRTDYTDPASGLASSILTIQSATLTGTNNCGAAGSGGPYTSATTITGTTNPSITVGFCYVYTLTGTDNVGNTSSIRTTVRVNLAPTDLVIANGPTPNVAGKAEANDTVTVTWNAPIQLSSVCSSWTNASQTITGVTVTMNRGNGAANNDLSVTGGTVGATACSGGVKVGSFATNSSTYQPGNINHPFTNSTITWNSSTNEMVITLGSCGASCPPGTAATSTYTYTPNTAIAAAAAPAATASGTATTGEVQNY